MVENKLKHLVKGLKDVFSVDEINKIAKESKFLQRKSSIKPEDFLIFNTLHGEDLCKTPLSQLASRYDAIFDKQVSKQAIDKRFNNFSVDFMMTIFNKIMYIQNNILKNLESTLNLHFERVIINDSTGFALPKEYADKFPGAGGSGSSSAIKIQLQYELLTGSFMKMDVFSGTKADATYLESMEKDNKKNDLKLADLGYLKIDYLKKLQKNGASFISKVKSNTALYIKNKKPERYKTGGIKKSSRYIKLDILELSKPLIEGETIELKDVYVGSKKEFRSRLIVTKLTEENKNKREIAHKENIRKKCQVFKQGRMDFNSVNAYISNVDDKILNSTQIHDLYTLRWQIEIMFKIWKSIFKINEVKKVKVERFKCFLYGRFIALLLSSSIVFTAKNIILEEINQEISEIKSFGSIFQYLPKLASIIFKSEVHLLHFFKKVFLSFKRFCLKSSKNNKKIPIDILEIIKLDLFKTERIAS
ncbi:MAG: IS4 family transposase [Cetobacterium sp.]|uniref:IS4 family transposase n=1 Tax=Cetobacterium sp. TaxID=2071632 RepID=UPI003F37EB5D